MEKISLRALVKGKHVNTISVLRLNENGYPYVTFIKQSGGVTSSNNVYFDAKTSAPLILSKCVEGENILKHLVNADIFQVENKEGETRFKIYIGGDTSKYATASQLEELFGLEENTEVDFSLEKFNKEFSKKPEPINVGIGG